MKSSLHSAYLIQVWKRKLKCSIFIHMQYIADFSFCVPRWGKRISSKFFFSFFFGYVPTLETTGAMSEINKCLKIWSADQIFTLEDTVTYLIQLKEFPLWHLSQSNSFYFFEQKWQETYWRNPIKKKVDNYISQFVNTNLVFVVNINASRFLSSWLFNFNYMSQLLISYF